MTTVETLVQLLRRAVAEPISRPQLVEAFWRGGEDLDLTAVPESVHNVIRELAFDLHYFVPTAAMRAEDSQYYGHKRFEDEVNDSLARLSELGVDDE